MFIVIPYITLTISYELSHLYLGSNDTNILWAPSNEVVSPCIMPRAIESKYIKLGLLLIRLKLNKMNLPDNKKLDFENISASYNTQLRQHLKYVFSF